ncbi:MAG: hypothetical protein A2Y82_05480 [Candidatus Buchananbacteria bacterium RBG_13_36_9]|uniref:Uncharacterized protein n=1 Tax=Candidatus Buchananbacteria bacterium RBG_13_36_9 TaxID=1797530 RepID=A0A1G1XRA9_9BACT|nr:MAG: hypothetical protein A2Y82_05480 [Candidatus Buchananbacteria bacterium RBG_13_36_9]
MHGADFLRQFRAVHGDVLLEKIKDRQRVFVFICKKCESVRLFWDEEMVLQDHIPCRMGSCNSTMTLCSVPMEQAKQVPKIWERVEFHALQGG